MVTLEPDRAILPAGLKPVILLGTAPLPFYAARRRVDRHGVIDTYLRLLQALKPQTVVSQPGRPALDRRRSISL